VRTVVKLADQQFDILYPIPETIPFHVITICLFQFFLHDNLQSIKTIPLATIMLATIVLKISNVKSCQHNCLQKRKGTTAGWFNNANFFRVQGQSQNAGFVGYE
jgi:ABC-type enterochelin transport system permease subunit